MMVMRPYRFDTAAYVTDSLVSAWFMNELSGDMLDSVGSNDGTVNGATQNGSEYSFDGVNDYVDIPDNNQFDTAAGTFSFWFKRDGSDNNEGLLGRRVSGSQFLILYWIAGDLQWRLYDGTNKFIINSGLGTFNDASWHHCAVMWGVNGEKMYIDGSAVGGSDSDTSAISFAQNMSVGAYGPGVTNYYFDGQIDTLLHYNKALSAAEVLQNYNAGRL